MKLLKRTWADISLDALEHNYNVIRQRVAPGCRFMGIIKADAYGHGAVPVGHALSEFGAEYLAVSNLEEAVQLRRGKISKPLLILGYTPAIYAQDLVQMNIAQEVHSLEYAKQLDDALAGTDMVLNIHLKLDTGMSRIGFPAYGNPAFLEQMVCAANLPHLHVEGVFTHFSVSDSKKAEDVAYTKLQYSRFCAAIDYLADNHVKPGLCHCCNSGATILYPEYAMDMVRPGIMTYGYASSEDTAGIVDLQPLLSLCTTVSQLREYPAGADISYGRRYRTEKDCRVAVLAIGYGDGLSRSLSGKISFLINGCTAPQIGTICMDACMVDVTDIPDVKPGDEAVFIGCSGVLQQEADQIAAAMGTIPYELLCNINKRVPRIYQQNGITSDILQYIV